MAQPVLQARNLSKRFGDLLAVKNLSLEVRQGEVFGFLGPNGAGKTTSINMMCGLLRPDSGSVLLHGQTLAQGSAASRAGVGVCPQDIIIWGQLTCLEQLCFMGSMYNIPAATARTRSQSLLEELGLAEKSNKLARTLSGGMKRRLNLALALVHEPDLVILDEPEAGLDPQSRVAVRGFIKSLASHKTVILTTQNMDEADRLADRVAIIDHGELLVLDTPPTLKKRLGEGDVLEIGIGETAEAGARALSALAYLADRVQLTVADGSLVVRALDVVCLLAEITGALSRTGIIPGEVRLRQNTLEDVFISLTGRRLRE